TGAWADGAGVEAGEAAVVRKSSDREVNGAVFRLVGEAFLHESLDERDHFADVLGGFRIDLCGLDAQEFPISLEGVGDWFGDFLDGFSRFVGAHDDLVVDVGDVHDLEDLPTGETQGTPQEILEQKRAKVAEVRGVVDGGPAGV